MIRVVIADDHAVVRKGLRQILSAESDIEVAGEAANADELLRLVRKQRWDAVVLDITMPGKSGLEVLKELKQERPRLPVLILTIHAEDQFGVRAMRAGALGYLTKEGAPTELVRAVRKVVAGERYVSPSLAEAFATSSNAPVHQILSDREYEVMRFLASGKTATGVAKELKLSVKTISTYRSRILDKLRLKNTAELMKFAIRNRLVD
ncbi:MAG TPA: response regulator transcription factor [Nitrospiraceae bacterium]|nr:response regulator transcription factor [Nitrospiraceae bacterium]